MKIILFALLALNLTSVAQAQSSIAVHGKKVLDCWNESHDYFASAFVVKNYQSGRSYFELAATEFVGGHPLSSEVKREEISWEDPYLDRFYSESISLTVLKQLPDHIFSAEITTENGTRKLSCEYRNWTNY